MNRADPRHADLSHIDVFTPQDTHGCFNHQRSATNENRGPGQVDVSECFDREPILHVAQSAVQSSGQVSENRRRDSGDEPEDRACRPTDGYADERPPHGIDDESHENLECGPEVQVLAAGGEPYAEEWHEIEYTPDDDHGPPHDRFEDRSTIDGVQTVLGFIDDDIEIYTEPIDLIFEALHCVAQL